MGSQQLYLEPRQHQLLLCLLQLPGQVVSREQLISQAWQGRIVSDSAINRAVSVLRKAFNAVHPEQDYIETVPKLGYRLQPPLSDAAMVHVPRPKGWRSFCYHRPVLVWLTTLLVIILAVWFFNTQPVSLHLSKPIPHTSFNGVERQLSLNLAGDRLLYQRQSDQGVTQIWLNTLTDMQHKAVTESHLESSNAAISPDGSQFAFVRQDSHRCQVLLQPLDLNDNGTTTSSVLHTCPVDNVPLLSWQPDGKVLYFRQRADKTQPYQIYQLTLASGAVHQLTLLHTDYNGSGDIALAASASQLAVLRYLSPASTALLLLAPDSGRISSYHELPERFTSLIWYDDNTLLLVAGQQLYRYQLDSRKLNMVYHNATPLNTLVSHGTQLYFSSTELNSDIWQQSKGQTTLRVDSSRHDTMPRLSHQATQLAFLSNRQGHYQLWLQDETGTERLLTELPGKPGFVRLEWSADDTQLLFSKDDAAYLVDVATGTLSTALPAEQQVGVINFGATPQQLLFSSRRSGDWQLWLYDRQTQVFQQLTEQGGYSGRIWQNALYFSKFHQDGLWRKALTGNEEQLLLAQFDKINWLNWQIEQGNLYYYQPDQGIYQLDLAGLNTTLWFAEPSHFVRHFNVRDGITVYARHSGLQGDIYRLQLQPQ
ncbi:hypothetical protein RNAN_2672 [Rheinheimera nanhaiensis E407-8]|uniref:OmpR/PhoB-type domain-containing protein n=2 Tax=Rheinheimera TaxID=67575 RepID=I1E038_9GAMM|nr:hypothetical protein RNAN_2672 [Rheinheimera nanhaiensis E407-8]